MTNTPMSPAKPEALEAAKAATTRIVSFAAIECPSKEASETRPFFTIGHSTRSVAEVADLLGAVGADMIVDVRRMPRSRANPQFNIEELPDALAEHQVGYRHIATLGGLRGRGFALAGSPNTLWRNNSFRNYADYALTEPFRVGFGELTAAGRERTCAIMCAEVLWWRCHRRIIADYLLARGATVFHIRGRNDVRSASPTPGMERVAQGLLYSEQAGAEAPTPHVRAASSPPGRPSDGVG